MKILITGGAGYIGSMLVDTLLSKNVDETAAAQLAGIEPELYDITVVDNLMYNQTSLFQYCGESLFHFVRMDVRDYDKLSKFVQKGNFDFIIPLAALVGAPLCEQNRDDAEEVNYRQMYGFIDTDAKIIIPITNSGYGIGGSDMCTEESPLKPVSVYGRTKIAAEEFLFSYFGTKKRTISLRLATVFGASPRMRTDLLVNDFVQRAVNDGVLVLFEEHFRRNYIHIRDVCLAFEHCIYNFSRLSGNVYNVGLSSANLTKRQLAEEIKKQIPELVIVSEQIGKDPDKRDYLVSNEKFEKTGWAPQYSLRDGIEELIKVYSMMPRNQYRNW